MKRKLPKSFTGKGLYFAKLYWFRVLFAVGAALISGALLTKSESQSVAPMALTNLCVYVRDIKKGEKIQETDLTQKEIPVEFAPKNVLQDCRSAEVIGKPVAIHIQANDLVQASNFAGKSFSQSSSIATDSAKRKVIYLNISDIHAFPPELSEGEYISMVGKSKDAQSSEKIADSIQVIDLPIQKNEDGIETISSIGLSFSEASISKLTTALAEKWSLHILMEE